MLALGDHIPLTNRTTQFPDEGLEMSLIALISTEHFYLASCSRKDISGFSIPASTHAPHVEISDAGCCFATNVGAEMVDETRTAAMKAAIVILSRFFILDI